MAIHTYKVKMLVEKDITVQIDDSIITPEWYKDFSSYMFDIDSPEELCEHIGHNVMFNGDDFVEGVGKLDPWSKAGTLQSLGVSISSVVDILEEFEVDEI